MTVIFIGRSGSGKGTQAEMLKDYFEKKGAESVYHLESGAHFREFIKESDTYAARLARKINEEGELQPQFLSAWVWSRALVDNLQENTHLIIDGTPRRLDEAKVLDTAFDFFNRKRLVVVNLEVSRGESVKRLQSRGRMDDADMENILEKLSWFETDVVPVVEHYRESEGYNFIEIDGMLSVEDIHKEIVGKIEKLEF